MMNICTFLKIFFFFVEKIKMKLYYNTKQ